MIINEQNTIIHFRNNGPNIQQSLFFIPFYFIFEKFLLYKIKFINTFKKNYLFVFIFNSK